MRNELKPIVLKNQEKKSQVRGLYESTSEETDYLAMLLDIREYDVLYHIRTCIDNEIRCSFWYEVETDMNQVIGLRHLKEKLDKPPIRVMAFDIETTKAPLKFPDSKIDSIMMISYMLDGKGFLITNRDVKLRTQC